MHDVKTELDDIHNQMSRATVSMDIILEQLQKCGDERNAALAEYVLITLADVQLTTEILTAEL